MKMSIEIDLNLTPIFKRLNIPLYNERKMNSFTGLLHISFIFSEQDPPMFNIIDFLSMSSHDFLLAEGTPDPLNYLGFYQNVKATLRENLH